MLDGSKFAKFGHDTRGAIGVLFAVSLTVLLLTGGLAVDYGRTFAVQSNIQSDLDAALLGAAVGMTGETDLDARAQGYFDENWKSRHGVSQLTVAVQRDGNILSGTVEAEVATTFMRLGGFEKILVQAHSQVEIAAQDVEVALALDTTGSMAGAKLTALKEAAKGLVEAAYQKPGSDEHIRIGIVPFAEYVNVGLANRNKSWISVQPDSSSTSEVCREVSPVTSTTNCRTETYTGSDDGTPYSYQAEVCDYTYGPPEMQCTTETNTQTWYGCVGSRTYPLDTRDETYTTPVPGIMNSYCSSESLPLTNDKSVLYDAIDGLNAAYETYIPAGLIWGWTLLSSEEPFAEAVAYGHKVNGEKVRKVLVLMTDGVNTRSPDYPYHWGSDTTRSNELTTELCTNIKSKGIEIFAVAFDLADGPIKDILRSCASTPSGYFDTDGATALKAAFANIAQDFAPLRLAR